LKLELYSGNIIFISGMPANVTAYNIT